MENTKKQIDWKNVGWRTLQGITLAILQSPLLYYIINSVMGIGPLYEGDYVFVNIDGEIQKVREMVPLWDSFEPTEWEYWAQWLALIAGITFTILFVKLLYMNKKKKEYFNKEQELADKRNEALINAIQIKQKAKEEKDVTKYL